MENPLDIDAADVSLEDIEKYTLAVPDAVDYPNDLSVKDLADRDGEGDQA